MLNRETHGHIKPSRGIRQGDPLSPFLFIFCAEPLVHFMNKAEKDGRITGMSLSKTCPSIQHLLFADDSFFVCRATITKCSEFLRCLNIYCTASGQEINFSKSAVTFGIGIDPIMRRLMANLLGIEKEGGEGKYLGLPECFSGSKQKLLAFISEKLNKRLSGWYAKILSLGERRCSINRLAWLFRYMQCFVFDCRNNNARRSQGR